MPSGTPFRVLLYVQHLLGVGHLQRSLLLAAAMARRDFAVSLVSGGEAGGLAAPPGVEIVQLPAVRSADSSFSGLVDTEGRAVDDAFRERRRERLLEIFAAVAPDALITETFPFGRRMLRYEIVPLLEAARSSRRCRLIVASIRDILQPRSKPGRDAETRTLLDRFYDRVLVHGDPRIALLGDSYALADAIADKVVYGGYICNPSIERPPGDAGNDEVIVSAGGSATGLSLLQAALAARGQCSLADLRWRLLASPAIEQREFERLRAGADDGVLVERNRADFRGLLARARLSISQAGYNTVTDILRTGVKSLLIPFAEAGELEQSLRARRLQALGRAVLLPPQRMSPTAMADAIEAAVVLDSALDVDLDGADHGARLLREWLDTAAIAS